MEIFSPPSGAIDRNLFVIQVVNVSSVPQVSEYGGKKRREQRGQTVGGSSRDPYRQAVETGAFSGSQHSYSYIVNAKLL
jgi:hypothetical protein